MIDQTQLMGRKEICIRRTKGRLETDVYKFTYQDFTINLPQRKGCCELAGIEQINLKALKSSKNISPNTTPSMPLPAHVR